MYDQQRADRICEALSQGQSLRKAAAAEGVSHVTVLGWVKDHKAEEGKESFGDQYARAREAGYALLADELVEIADDGSNDSYQDEDGKIRVDQEVVARSRLRLDTRKWLLSKMLPKVYGDKVQTELTGPNGGPIQTQALSPSTAALAQALRDLPKIDKAE
jgi:hypothetical protein